jgi:hypothetical protein
MKRWRGVVHLVRDAVEHGATAIEQLQKDAAATPFRVLEALPAVSAPARQVHRVHDLAVSGIYGAVRLVNRGVGAAADVAFDVLEARRRPMTKP